MLAYLGSSHEALTPPSDRSNLSIPLWNWRTSSYGINIHKPSHKCLRFCTERHSHTLADYQYDAATGIIIITIILTATACERNSWAASHLLVYTAHPHSKTNCQCEKWHMETAGCVIWNSSPCCLLGSISNTAERHPAPSRCLCIQYRWHKTSSMGLFYGINCVELSKND